MKVIVYGTPNCPYCVRAKEHATEKGHDVEYIDIVEKGMTKVDLSEIVGKPVATVPQIFVDDVYVGGFTELVPYLKSKEVTEDMSFDMDL